MYSTQNTSKPNSISHYSIMMIIEICIKHVWRPLQAYMFGLSTVFKPPFLCTPYFFHRPSDLLKYIHAIWHPPVKASMLRHCSNQYYVRFEKQRGNCCIWSELFSRVNPAWKAYWNTGLLSLWSPICRFFEKMFFLVIAWTTKVIPAFQLFPDQKKWLHLLHLRRGLIPSIFYAKMSSFWLLSPEEVFLQNCLS